MDYKEIDCLIAEKVMGYGIIPPSIHEPTGFKNDGYFVVKEETNDEDEVWISQLYFNPSTDIQDAWKIVNKLKQEDQYYFRLENGDFYDYECRFTDYFSEEIFIAEADTAPLAICKAALKTIGIEIN